MDTTNLRESVRINARISADTNDWLDRKAYEMGLTKSALVNLACETYRKETEVVTVLPEMFRKMQEEMKKIGE
ncbi:hypothetical protein [Pseudomonas sp. 2995-1]|uniref:hypothetical protein n=1 Tax=Pseudomonas sp. 2995-1 TaxID=1712679 RepID=UPI000C15664E|nr:hypothetical protein [Pseudomonas sp. 2995-1]PIB59176.1 hypothetical protein AOA61_02145 [Pseudomonas sp. 2995-1]